MNQLSPDLRDLLLRCRAEIDAVLALESAAAIVATVPKPLTLKDAVAIAGKHPDTLIRWAKNAGIGWKNGGRWEYDEYALRDYMRGRRKHRPATP